MLKTEKIKFFGGFSMKKLAILFVLFFIVSVNLFAEDSTGTNASTQNGPAYGATNCESTGSNSEKAPLEGGSILSTKPSENICAVYPQAASCNLGTDKK